MFKRSIFAALFLSFFPLFAMAAEGLKSVVSGHSVNDTMDRLEAAVTAAGFKVFARVDHAAGAKTVDLPLAPTQLLIFGNPKGGTVLMQKQITVGIDLPLKFLVWEADGKVMIGWNDAQWMAGRHGIDAEHPVIGKVGGALQKFADKAAAP